MKKLLLALVAVATIATTTQTTKYKTCIGPADQSCGAGQVCRKEIIQGIGVEDREEYVCTPADTTSFEVSAEGAEAYWTPERIRSAGFPSMTSIPAGAELRPGAEFPPVEYVKDLA